MDKLFKSVENARKELSKFTPEQKADLERQWDAEHAYYSSTLEGSQLDRKEFDELSKQV